MPINAFVIEHSAGVVLFDTGQDRASVTDPDYFPGGIVGAFYRRTAQADIPEDQTLERGLHRLGYQLSDVSHVVISHLHQDHIGGLGPLREASIHISQDEWDTLDEAGAELKGLMRRHIDLPGLSWDRVATSRISDRALEPFGSAYDLFGDGTLMLLPTPGHTPGSISMLVRNPGRCPLLMVGDLTYSTHLLDCGHVPGAGSKKQLQASTAMINQLRANLQDSVVLAAHDPNAAADLAKVAGS
jgi:glyoxylase-like metal-dependent hydrolase (beta-lactamase superfamily II)